MMTAMHREPPVEEPQNAPSDFVSARDLLARARYMHAHGDIRAAARALGNVAGSTSEMPLWLAASREIKKLPVEDWARRSIRLAVLGSHTTGHLIPTLVTAAAAHGIALEVYEGPYGQFQQEVLDQNSGLAAFSPDVVLLAVDARALRIPALSSSPDDDLAAEVSRWRRIWSTIQERWGATILQMSFVAATHDEFGSLSLSLQGSRRRLVRALNLALTDAPPEGVHFVDAESVATRVGSEVWSDLRYWFLSKHVVGIGALPTLAREVAQVLAGAIGLNRKVLVLDLDGTLWGGVVGEDGAAGIEIGDGPAGEAHQSFQEYLVRLRRRGMLLVVVSKNNADEARSPFVERPEMRLTLEDFTAFIPSWDDKSQVIHRVAADLGIGLDAFVFVDDNPIEREMVRRQLPDVGVVPLPSDPAHYIAALAEFPGMQSATLTIEDARRTDQYRARLQVAQLEAGAGSRDEFLASLGMVLTIEPITDANIKRVSQLIGKTNQFNLTGRRHSAARVLSMSQNDDAVAMALRLRDDFDDHGLIGVLLAVTRGEDLIVDTWVISCRVLGRGLEAATLSVLREEAQRMGRSSVVGLYIPTRRNAAAKSTYSDAGFTRLPIDASYESAEGEEWWRLDVTTGLPSNSHVEIQRLDQSVSSPTRNGCTP